jgi:hypothetical protein
MRDQAYKEDVSLRMAPPQIKWQKLCPAVPHATTRHNTTTARPCHVTGPAQQWQQVRMYGALVVVLYVVIALVKKSVLCHPDEVLVPGMAHSQYIPVSLQSFGQFPCT